MKQQTTLLACLCLFIASRLYSQQEALSGHSIYNLYMLSSAAAGQMEQSQAFLSYKKNWTGMPASPEILAIAADGQISQNCGWGLKLIGNKNGIISNTGFATSFRYTARITKKQKLSFGISGGFSKQSIDFSQVKAKSPEEFLGWPQQQTIMMPDAEAGLMYKYNETELIFAVGHLLQNNFSFANTLSNTHVSMMQLPYFTLIFRQRFFWQKQTWSCTPAIVIRSTMGLPALIELNSIFSFDEKLHFGAFARSSKTCALTLGYGKISAMRFLYSYEHDASVYSAVKGGHEISLLIVIKPAKK